MRLFLVWVASASIGSGASLASQPTTTSAAGPGVPGAIPVRSFVGAAASLDDHCMRPNVVTAPTSSAAAPTDTTNFTLAQTIALSAPRMMTLVDSVALRPAAAAVAKAFTAAGAALTELAAMALEISAALKV